MILSAEGTVNVSLYSALNEQVRGDFFIESVGRMLSFELPMDEMKNYASLNLPLMVLGQSAGQDQGSNQDDNIDIVLPFSPKHNIHLFEASAQLFPQSLQPLHLLQSSRDKFQLDLTEFQECFSHFDEDTLPYKQIKKLFHLLPLKSLCLDKFFSC